MEMPTRTILSAVLMALALLASPSTTRAQNSRGCAWPIELSPEGFGNWLGPESLARYWVMPLINYDAVAIKGTYPNARYFSLVVYDTNNGTPTGVEHSLYDAEIAPDQGSNNPFANPGAGNGTYTVMIVHKGQTSGNTIGFSSEFAWVLLRMYEPGADPALSGRSLMGGVPLPTITVTSGGMSQALEPCSPVNKLPDVTASLPFFFPPGFDILGEEGTPSDQLWFAPPTTPPPVLLPNPDNKYIAMFPGNAYQPGRIIVIHGKAPITPGTVQGAPISTPAGGSRSADVRFWSLCVNDLAMPVPTVGCTADLTTKLEGGYYTVVISDDLLRPSWLKPNVTWLPWGDEDYAKLVFARNMLPGTNFSYSVQKAIEAHCTFDFNFPTLPDREPVDAAGRCAQQVMGDYYPVAVWCDKSTFEAGGVRACLKEGWKPGGE